MAKMCMTPEAKTASSEFSHRSPLPSTISAVAVCREEGMHPESKASNVSYAGQSSNRSDIVWID